MSVRRKLEKAYREAEVIPFNRNSKFIIMSDCHRGQGNYADNFLQNQNVYFGALQYYFDRGYTYIELGDGDELWENRNMKNIINVHSDVFWMLSRFYAQNRFYMIYGNHDIVKRKRNFMENNFEEYYCDSQNCCISLFPGMRALQSIILEDSDTHNRIFLAHGHQGSLANDTFWRITRFLVRNVWKPLELIGFNDPTGEGRTRKKREIIEKELSAYADDKGEILIAGHTHRPVFSKPGESFYFNDGSCVHPRCITGIEIENGRISLVKWSVCTNNNRILYVGREVLEGPERIDEYYRF